MPSAAMDETQTIPLAAATPVAPALTFNHLGIIVVDLAPGGNSSKGSLEISRWSEVVDDEAMGVLVQFGGSVDGSGPIYELVAPRGKGSPISGQLTRGKGVLNHVARRTLNLEALAAHLRATGCFTTGDPKPARAYGGAMVQFWVSPLRFLIELIAKVEHTHQLCTGSAPGRHPFPPLPKARD